MQSRIFPVFTALILALPANLFGAQDNAAPETAKEDASTAKALADLKITPSIVYKQVGDQKLDLMLFHPLEKKYEKSPVVVYIHGGGWGGGNKYHGLLPCGIGVIRELNRQGVTVASIEYRLTKVGVATANESAADCKDAVRFLAKNAAQYHLDPTRVGTFGESAGGNLALITALGEDTDYPCDPSLNGVSYKICCVAAYYPLVSFVDAGLMKGGNFENPQRLIPILGGLLKDKQDLAMKLSPIELLRTNSPPILLAHGDADTILNFTNSIAMRDGALTKGVPVECIISKAAGHSFNGQNISPSIAKINQQTVAFFLKYLSPGK